jgi:hypothetical protein
MGRSSTLSSVRETDCSTSIENKKIPAVIGSCQVLDSPVKRDKNTLVFHGESEQIGIGDLLMAEQPGGKWSGENRPRFSDGPIAITGRGSKISKNSSGLRNGPGRGAVCGVGCHPNKP